MSVFDNTHKSIETYERITRKYRYFYMSEPHCTLDGMRIEFMESLTKITGWINEKLQNGDLGRPERVFNFHYERLDYDIYNLQTLTKDLADSLNSLYKDRFFGMTAVIRTEPNKNSAFEVSFDSFAL